MMDNRNPSECKFNHDIVAYMYGELPAPESSVFESHLLDCTDCTDEFAAISNARFEVYDWKKLEFDPLPTPRFGIPYETEGVGFAEKVKAVFARGWAVPGLAFAGLAVLAVSAAIVLFSGDSGTASFVAEVGNENAPMVDRTVVAEPEQAKPAAATEPKIHSLPKPRPAVLNASAPPLRQSEPRRPGPSLKLKPRPAEAKQASVQTEQKSVPRLNGFPEDEDTSLRLAELFEDIETRD